MKQHAIVAENLVYRYNKIMAVDEINFEVGVGEVFGFLGPNGAGKSTTVKMLTGQLRPHAGRVLLLGKDLQFEREVLQAQIGVAFEFSNLYEQMNAVENLSLFAKLFGIKNFDARPLLEQVGLLGREHERVERFSKGMKQRLMIARALVNTPRILFLDEPTDGLDPVSAEAIRRMVRELSQQGTTVFLTTHDMHEADKLSHRVAFINGGKILALDTPHALKLAHGKRLLKVTTASNNGGGLHTYEIPLDGQQTANQVQALFAEQQVVTVHSEEATLEDIFIELAGRRLS